ncbi:scavenger receptor cysteine-rich type 1 protein M130 [Polypterus senegalus]|uniref:scavenger receptor cysteine-rich type 1 protein M130 n=1 Tax=Polypterus senegalus TaxID=55291 RepID=UPI0019630C08|nr:scavenger receptor cysteine-rich type 1 protein M130 [Polypterus senegalus]
MESWSSRDATVVCRQLNCGTRTQMPNSSQYKKSSKTVCLKGFLCSGNEKHLGSCSQPKENKCVGSANAAVQCVDHIALRLLNGTSVCDGRVEIFYNGSWGTVCDDSWGFPDANVVCRQLQCEAAVNAITPVSYGPGTGHIWLDNVRCRGNESFLWDCRHQKWGKHDCRHKEDVGVNCTEFKMLRLTNGCSGQLQVFYKNLWGSICANKLDKATATMICQELGCGSLKSTIIEGISKLNSDPKWLDEVNCRGHETSIWQCPSSPWGKNKCTRNEVAEFSCSGTIKVNTNKQKPCSEDLTQKHCTEPLELRLAGGTDNCSGRVEIKYGDTWGTVCDDDWDLKDVKVVCRQLRCGDAVSAELEFGGGSGVIWLNKVKCRGTEAHLWDCQHEPLGKNDCVHKEDAGVKCTGGKVASLETDGSGYYDDIAIEKTEDLQENVFHDELSYTYDDAEDPLENTKIDSHAAAEYTLPLEYDDIEHEAT